MSLRNDPSYALVVLGALLHDIGKLRLRAENESNAHTHYYYSKEFVEQLPTPIMENGEKLEIQKLAELVNKHHKEIDDRDLNKLLNYVKEADHHTAMAEREASTSENPNAPLQSIFKKVCICESRKEHDLQKFIYAPKKLTRDSIFPDDAIDPIKFSSEAKASWNELLRECKLIPPNIESYVETLVSLLKKYTFFTLSAGYKSQPTVPLYDHLKVTAACAAALYKHCKESGMSPVDAKRPFSLIVGDISGIQDFIFKVHSTEASRKGTAKRLRGRSLQVQLIMEGAARKILDHYDLPGCNLLWCTGGQFAILAPSYAIKDYELLMSKINRELWEKFGDALYIAAGCKEFSLKDEEDFMNALRGSQRIAELKKNRRLFEVLQSFPSPLIMGTRTTATKFYRCPSCASETSSEGFCERCREQEELGGKLPGAEYLFVGTGLEPDFRFAGYSFSLLGEDDLDKIKHAKSVSGTLFRLNDSDFIKEDMPGSVAMDFKFIGLTVPKLIDGGNLRPTVMSFDLLVNLGKGAKKLGVAKGDVDNLGYIMHSGIKPVKIYSATNLSSLLDAFFAGYLNDILGRFVTHRLCKDCEKKLEAEGANSQGSCVLKFKSGDDDEDYTFTKWWVLRDPECLKEIESKLCKNCLESKTPVIYISYSGGDDFLIIGPWDAIVEAIIEIRREFDRLVSGHPDLGMSIGYTLCDEKQPISLVVKELASSLAEAKEYRSSARNDESIRRKDMISIFGDCVNLSQTYANGEGAFSFERLVEFGKKLEGAAESGKIPRGLIHDLIHIWRNEFDNYREPEKLEKARREVRKYMPILKYKLKRNLNLKGEEFKEYDQKITEFMPWILVPASWASLRLRSRRD
ncbi:MAG: type III-A CRISPR-associated protein Cas10/Csm1 [Candidatus Methanosuratincola petrocarbonis]